MYRGAQSEAAHLGGGGGWGLRLRLGLGAVLGRLQRDGLGRLQRDGPGRYVYGTSLQHFTE